jgi:Tfp pilus assembly PilM family ATPase
MVTTVYIGNDTLKVMTGQVSGNKIQVKKCVKIPMEEGLILNGVLLNAGVIQTKLEETFKSAQIPKKGIHLVIDGSSVSIKVLKVPLLPPKKMLGRLQSEFTDMNLSGMVMDYSIVTPKNEEGTATILASVVQREFIENYVKLFREAKLELECIDVSSNSIMKLCRKIKSVSDTTFSMMVLDNNILVQTLFVNGIFKMVRRNRLLSQRGTEEFDKEVEKNISNMIQFNRSEKTGSEIGCFYLCGFPEEIKQKFIKYREDTGVDVAAFPVISNEILMAGAEQPTDWVYNLGTMFYTK